MDRFVPGKMGVQLIFLLLFFGLISKELIKYGNLFPIIINPVLNEPVTFWAVRAHRELANLRGTWWPFLAGNKEEKIK